MINRILIALLATCALTVAMVPRHRRAIDADENHGETQGVTLCAPTTPCGWAMYERDTKHVYQNITNTYCYCPRGELCLRGPDDETANAFVYLCQDDNTNPVNTPKS